jgi:hypothetical protein
VLYRLPDVIASSLVFVVEGEKNANDLSRALALYIKAKGGITLGAMTLDRVAVTTNPGGAAAWKREYDFGRYFAGKVVIKLGDNDGPGRLHDRDACDDIAPHALKTFTLDLPVGEGEDISDFLKKQGIEDLLRLLPNRKEWNSPKQKAPIIAETLEPRTLLVKPSELVVSTDNVAGDWLVEGLIERGTRDLVVAPPKTGKSLLFLELVLCLSTQESFLGAKPYHRSIKCAVISREDGPRMVSRRLKQLAAARNLSASQIDRNLLVNTEEQSARFKIDRAADTPQPYTPTINGASTGVDINPPIIFEATPRLAAQTSPAQIWIATSSGVANYGGCQCYISTDGGLSYAPASENPTLGSAMQAEVGLTSDQGWPAASDPDTTNNLFVSFAETLPGAGGALPGTLPSFSATQRDNFQYPCYVGFNDQATLDAEFTTGDTTQITQLGVLFSDPTILNALPSDAVIINIFPMLFMESGPIGSPVVTSVFAGTGLTTTSGGALVQTITGAISAPLPAGGGSGIGTSLTGQEIRYNLTLNTTGPGAFGKVPKIGWAIIYTSATPSIDPLAILPFGLVGSEGCGWAIPKTIATGMVGSGTNATVTAFGGIAPTGIPYELMTYNEATLLMGGYELMATGSGNELRRGVFGAPSPGVGMNHPPGSPFALLNPSAAGLFKIDMDPIWVGTQLWFKFPTFNTFGSVLSNLQFVTAWPYTPTGIPGNIGPAQGFLVNGA